MKQKLQTQKVTKQDWNEIGKNKVMQTTVLDDIFKKYLDYQEIDKKQKLETKNYTTLQPVDGDSMAKHDFFNDAKRGSIAQTTMTMSKAGDINMFKNHAESIGSLDSDEKLNLRFPTKIVDKVAEKQKAEDAFMLLQMMDEKGARKHTGKFSLANNHIK